MNEFLSIVYLSGRLLDEHDYFEEKSFQNMDYMLIKLSDVPVKIGKKVKNDWLLECDIWKGPPLEAKSMATPFKVLILSIERGKKIIFKRILPWLFFHHKQV